MVVDFYLVQSRTEFAYEPSIHGNKQECILLYMKNGMSAMPSNVLNLIPEEIQEQIFGDTTQYQRYNSISNAIYSLKKKKRIVEKEGRYYLR